MAEVEPDEFVGDGKYIGDGGKTLQKLWNIWQWSEIKNCPGRYVTKKNKEAEIQTPKEILESHFEFVSGELKHFKVDSNKDEICVAMFHDGGGIITYLKLTSCREESDLKEKNQLQYQYIHTLNTESGFQRKIKALNIDISLLIPFIHV